MEEIAQPKGMLVGNSMEDHFRKYQSALFKKLKILSLGTLLQRNVWCVGAFA